MSIPHPHRPSRPFSRSLIPCLALAAVSSFSDNSFGEDLGACPEGWVAQVDSNKGRIEVAPIGSTEWQELDLGDCIFENSQVRISGGRAGFLLTNETNLAASGDSVIEFTQPQQRNWISLLRGWLHFLSRTPTEFDIETPYVNAGVKGTEFTLTAQPDTQSSLITVLEGSILADDGQTEIAIDGGYSAQFQANQVPTTFRIENAKDAVQWTLYYPPLLVPQDPLFESARQQLLNNEFLLAANTLESVAEDDRNSNYHSLYSAIHLFTGNVDQAEQRIEQALAQNPYHSTALALRGVMQVTKQQLEDAEESIQRAITASSNFQERANALLAQSYLHQAKFDLEASLESINQALDALPSNALLLSRQAELALMLEDYKLADNASEQAVQLQPNLSHAHTTRGFVFLQSLKLDRALSSFNQAVQLDSSDPLPHLGIGLIEIRKNRVEVGRRHLELAAVLDPGFSLVRSYLGKAYFTENRDDRALTQYELAEQMDPNDPTPWLYRAILEQNSNRPFAALAALNKSIELNDNRAVYRSRFNLDKDGAARTTSQGDIYLDLGLDDKAEKIASESILSSPGNSSGHLLLAQSYADDTSLDGARVSEMFQAQIAQPISATPILSIFSQPNLSVFNGVEPSDLGFNEYSGLFTRESSHTQLITGAGNNNSHTNSLIYSTIYKKLNLAAGYYDYSTDGFREGAEVEHEILNLFTQYQASPNWDLQFEAVFRDSFIGDVEQFLLQPELADETTTWLADTQLYRINSSYKPTPASDLYTSVRITEGNELQTTELFARDISDAPLILDFNIDFVIDSNIKEQDFNLRYDHTFNSFSTSSGLIVGKSERSFSLETTSTVTTIPPPPGEPTTVETPPGLPIPDEDFFNYIRLYSYWHLEHFDTLQVTLGGSYDVFESVSFDKEQHEFNPKFGIAWHYSPRLRFNLGAAQNVNFFNFRNQTLEPTQVSHTNQVIDNAVGTLSEIYSMSFDYSDNSPVDFGMEVIMLNSSIPFVNADPIDIEKQEVKLYANIFKNPFSLSMSYHYEDRSTDPNLENGDALLNTPVEYKAHKVPLQLHYHNEAFGSFIFAINLIHQEGIFEQSSGGPSPMNLKINENFTTLDFNHEKSYWNNKLKLSVSIRNVFDEDFRIENKTFNDPSRRTIGLTPGRSFFATLRLNFN